MATPEEQLVQLANTVRRNVEAAKEHFRQGILRLDLAEHDLLAFGTEVTTLLNRLRRAGLALLPPKEPSPSEAPPVSAPAMASAV